MTQLSPQERIFFDELSREPGKTIPIVDLLNASNSDGDNDVAKVVVCRIRQKLGVRIDSRRGRRGEYGAYALVVD